MMDSNKLNHGDSERTIGDSSEVCGGEQQNQQQKQQEEPTTRSRRGSNKRKLADDEEEDDEDDESLLITSTLQQQQSEPVEQSVKDKSDREEQQMEANRKRARDIRKRKKKMIADMQQKIVQLTMENQMLLQNTQTQQTEIQHLRAYVQQQEVMQQLLLQDRQRLLGTLPLQLNTDPLPHQHSGVATVPTNSNNTNTSNHTGDLNLLSNTETTPQLVNNGNSASNFPAASDLIQQLMRQQILWGSGAGGGGGGCGNNPHPPGNSIHIGGRALVSGDSSSNELRNIDTTRSMLQHPQLGGTTAAGSYPDNIPSAASSLLRGRTSSLSTLTSSHSVGGVLGSETNSNSTNTSVTNHQSVSSHISNHLLSATVNRRQREEESQHNPQRRGHHSG